MNKYVEKWVESSLILKILIGLIIGAILGLAVPQYEMIGLLGQLFVSALKAIAPLLVFVLVASALSKAGEGIRSRFKTVIVLYIFSTFLSAMVAVTGSFLFPVSMHLTQAGKVTAPGGLGEVISNEYFHKPIAVTLSRGLSWNPILGNCIWYLLEASWKYNYKECI